MTRIERDHLLQLEREARALQTVWLRERDEKRAEQITANAEIRRHWMELDLLQGDARAADQHALADRWVSRQSRCSRAHKEKLL